jgi:hypothetical protein
MTYFDNATWLPSIIPAYIWNLPYRSFDYRDH